MPRAKRLTAISASLLLLFGATRQPADALDMGSMGKVSPKKTNIRADFPPIPGVYPHQGPTGHPFSGFRPFGCATYNYCNRHTFDIDVPKGYIDEFKGTDIVSFGIRVTLSWADPKGNNMALFVWPDDDPVFGGPSGVCDSPVDKECATLHPEIFSVVEPKPEDDETTEEVDESKKPVTIYMSVVNTSGVNTGYTLELQWFLIPFGSFPDFKPPKAGEVSRQVTASRTPLPFEDPGTKGDDDRSTKILIPGPDGKLIEQELDFFAAGHRFDSPKTGTASWVWVVSGVLSGIAVLAFVYLVWQRRRREALG